MNTGGEAVTATGRWKNYLAIVPMLLVMPGCSHTPGLSIQQQTSKTNAQTSVSPPPSSTVIFSDKQASDKQPPENQPLTEILKLKPQLRLTQRLPAVIPPDPLLAGISANDIAMAKRQAKRNYERSWKTIAKRSRFVRERMSNTLHAMQAPTSLQVIPAVESTYSPYAISHAGAVGLWQLMPRTAHSLGVHSDKKLDGRRDIDSSTRAAVIYLLKMHQRFDSWPLAIAAYNMGPNAVARRLRKTAWQNSDGLENMPIPAPTRAYVQHVIGLVALLHDNTFSFPEPVKTRKLELKAPIDIHLLAQISGMPEHDIFRFNPCLNQSQYLLKDITIHVPESHFDSVQRKLALAGPKFVRKVVKKGDSLWTIARTHHTTVATLKSLNRDLGKYLRIGQPLKVPANQLARASANANPLLPTNRRIRYKVRAGDSLWRIANRFGTTPKAIARSNRISMNAMIRTGDRLWVYAKVRPS